MNSRTNHSVTSVRQAVLAGIIMLAGSAAANAAAPEAPYLDWVEATEVVNDTSDYVAVDVGWSRYDFDDVSSVQYRLNGKPVMSHAVDPGQTYGDNVLTIEYDGIYDLTVALCNVDGCTDSVPMEILISDEDGVEVLARQIPLGSDSFTAADSYSHVSEAPMMPEFTALAMPATLVNGLASELGKAALSGLVRAGADAGLSTALKFLGLGDMALGVQVKELQTSVSALNTKIDHLTSTIENLENKLDWKDFTDEHSKARSAVNKITGAYDSVVSWIESGETPDREGWTDARRKVVENLEELAGTVSGQGGGIADVYDGATYRLMNAIPQKVSTVESYWPIVDEYRDYYRMAIALGFLTLDLIADEFDDTSTTRSLANNALEAGQFAVSRMYGYGIAPQTPRHSGKVLDFVQLRGSINGYAAREYADYVDYSSVKVAGMSFSNAMATIANNFKPELHGNITLEQLLEQANVPTTYVIENTNSFYSTGWTAIYKPGGSGGTKQWKELRPLIGQVEGNQWVESYERYCPSGAVPCEGDDGWFYGTSSEVESEIGRRKSAIKSAGGYTLNNGRYASTHHSVVDLTDRLNHGSRAAEMDADLVRLAAFGDGVPTLTAGMLPDGYGASQCIGLPEQNLYLLEVENYDLRWQPNGDLTLRDADNKILWQTGTAGNNRQLCFYDYGALMIDNNIKVLYNSETSDWDLGGYGARTMKLHQDGALQLVNELNDVVWQVGPFE